MSLNYKRHIIKNKPFEDGNGQYNYGRVENEPRHLLGKPTGLNYGGAETELYTVVEHKDVDWSAYPEGIAWNFYDSKLHITELGIQGRNRETDKDRYYNHQVAVYLYDSDRTGQIPETGNELRALVADGSNSFPNTAHTIHQRNFGTYYFPHSCDPQGWGGDECRRQFVGDEFPTENMIIYDWPVEGHSKTNDAFATAAVFNTDLMNWSKAITGKISNSKLYIIVRCSGDESEYAPVGHGWLKLSGGYKSDELQRRYNVFTINKKDFYDVFVRGEEKIFGYGGSSPKDITITRHTYDDNHGGAGHWGLPDAQGAAYTCDDIRIKASPPIWTPAKALLQNYKWAKKDTFGQLHPKYNLDYTGFPDSFYEHSDKFWDASLIKDFRPLSKVKSIIDTDDKDTDLQNFYEKGTLYSLNSSAPMTVNLQFDYVKNINKFNPSYYDTPLEDNDYGIHYGWFVVNWDWNEDWPGGETLEEIAESDFPSTAAGIGLKNFESNTYKLKHQGNTEVDGNEMLEFDVLNNEAVHTYTEPGMKIIKVVHLTYVESHHAGSDNEDIPYSGNYIQALQWKLSTIKINLSADRAFANDFADIGGADYTYLPYPDVEQYDYPVGELQFNEFGVQYWCEDGLNAPDNVEPVDFINCETQTTAHPVVSGLALESTYVQTLKGLLQTDSWSESEGDDKILAEKSYENTPLQSVDEMGDFLGQSDLSTLRYFERPFNMHEFLDLNMVYNVTDDPSNNIYCKNIKQYMDVQDTGTFTETDASANGSLNYPGPLWCGQKFAPLIQPDGSFENTVPTSDTGEGSVPNPGVTETRAVCRNGEEILLASGFPASNHPENIYRLMTGDYVTVEQMGGAVDQSIVANGEWACAQEMGEPYYTAVTENDPNFYPAIQLTYGQQTEQEPIPADIGKHFYNYNNVEFWDGEINKFPAESSATDIFISEYPILHDKCLVELNFENYDAVTIRDTSGNGCKAVAFGDYSIKKDKKNTPTQRDSSIDVPKIGTTDDDKAY